MLSGHEESLGAGLEIHRPSGPSKDAASQGKERGRVNAGADPAVLASERAAVVAAWTDRRVLQDARYGESHRAPVSFLEFRAFAKAVWAGEGRDELLYVTRVESLQKAIQAREFDGAAAAARWAIPSADFLDMPRTGELAGTTGAVPYVDVKDEGLFRLFALHEVAHLLVDSVEVHLGDGCEWAEAHSQLIARHLSPDLSALWRAEFTWWWEKARAKIAANPNWLA